MTDLGTQAWREAEASAPKDEVIFDTLELQHATFTQDGVQVPIRIVANVSDDQVFHIEAGAAYDADSDQSFMAVPLHADWPEYGEGVTPRCKVTVDNVSRFMVDRIIAAAKFRGDLTVLYRQYSSLVDDAPIYGPVEFKMKSVTVTPTTISGYAMIDNLSNRKVPTRKFTLREFPGLLG